MKKDDVILDPFCGGGTSIIAALSKGARVIASDLNPMAVFMTRVLIRPTPIYILEEAFKTVEAIAKEKICEMYTIKCPKCGGNTTIDYLVWNGKIKQSKPEKIKFQCSSCAKNDLFELSDARARRQIQLSQGKYLSG